MKRKRQNPNQNNDDFITITVDNNLGENIEKTSSGRKSTRIGHMNDKKSSKKKKQNNNRKSNDNNIDHDDGIIGDDFEAINNGVAKGKGRGNSKRKTKVNDGTKGLRNWKKWSRKKKIGMGILFFLLAVLIVLLIIFTVYIVKAKGSVKDAVLNVASDIVGEQDPIFVLILGVSADISTELTDTIMLCGYNPDTQKAFMVSVPRDTFVGKSESYANGYDKINAQYQKSAEKTCEAVELLTGVNIDYYVVIRNISISSIFDCIGEVEFDVPINMNYDDPTQDLHIHLKKGYQTLNADQVEQLLRFRHNNDGSSYPSSYGDNDYGRMRTQREFIKTVMNQMTSLQNVGKLKDVASMVYTNLQTNMSGYTLLDYVPYGLKFSTSNLRSEQLPGQSELINELWFYKASKSDTKKLMNELMVYLEIDDNEIDKYYKYADSIKGVKPDGNYVANEIVIDDEDDDDTSSSSSSSKKKTNTTKNTNTVNQDTCEHKYVVYETTDATCTKNGSVTYKCTLCNKEYSKATDALGHSYSNGVCSRCGNKKETTTTESQLTDNKPEACSHTYKQTASTAAGCTTTGSITQTCTKCNNQQTTTIPALGHNYSDTTGICSRCKAKNPNFKEPEPDKTPEVEIPAKNEVSAGETTSDVTNTASGVKNEVAN